MTRLATSVPPPRCNAIAGVLLFRAAQGKLLVLRSVTETYVARLMEDVANGRRRLNNLKTRVNQGTSSGGSQVRGKLTRQVCVPCFGSEFVSYLSFGLEF